MSKVLQNAPSGVAKVAWDVLSRAVETAWEVLFEVANLCGMFCPGCQKIAWDVLSWDVLSYIHVLDKGHISKFQGNI